MIYSNTKTETKYIDISDFSFGNNGKQLPVVSLFSGAGGLDIGLEESGFQTAVCVEYDTDCRPVIFNGAELEHWNTKDLQGTKYSLVFYNCPYKVND
jgi:DNA (cytosine-5)-methyltransferase 1